MIMTEDISSASVRRDGSSKFAAANKWGNFWSVGAAWNLGKNFSKKLNG
jgi:hypothetical protein